MKRSVTQEFIPTLQLQALIEFSRSRNKFLDVEDSSRLHVEDLIKATVEEILPCSLGEAQRNPGIHTNIVEDVIKVLIIRDLFQMNNTEITKQISN